MNARQLTLRIALLAVTTACHPAPAATVPDVEPAWQTWSEHAFSRAQRENRLILISLQAGFCHWCHVMNATTYRDPRVLALLAEHFVLLRADEASRPDLRERYAAWGWPATALLTPDARPIVNLRGYQRPAQFAALLEQLVEKQRRGQPLEVKSDAVVAPRGDARARLRRELDEAYDAREGGWGTPQKYPYAAPVEHALLVGDRARAEQSLAGYRKLIDPVAGGMFQYSLGGVWDQPHYEKLLSIQAGAIANFSAAYRASGDPTTLSAAQALAEYTLRTLRSPQGAFYASQEADVGHVGEASYLEGARYYASDRRGAAPSVDRHVYTNLNGMMIAALCELYRADGEERWLTAAREAAQAVRQLASGAAYRHTIEDEVLYLSDQVEMARALSALATATADPSYTQAANATLDWLEANLHGELGFYSHTQREAAVGVFAERVFPRDENARLARLYLTRAHVEDEARFAELAQGAIRVANSGERLGRQAGELLLAYEQQESPYVMFSVVGNADDGAALALQRAAYRAYVPQGIVSFSSPERSRYPYPGRAAVYLCSDSACSSPITEVARLAPELAAFLAAEARP